MFKSLYSPRRREFIQQWMIQSAALAGGALLPSTIKSYLPKSHLSSSNSVPEFSLPELYKPGRFAEELLTPPMVEGPFYPTKLPLDTDNDLLILNDSINPAIGQITHFSGRILDSKGNPIRNARVEIWQCDANGVYLHPEGGDRKKLDTNFQGFGRFTTGVKGEYYFRTIKPVPYTGRTPHIHVAVYVKNKRVLTTQCLIKGHKLNAKDGLFNRIKGEKLREKVLANFDPLPNSKIGELSATFDIVLGVTPDEERVKQVDNSAKKR